MTVFECENCGKRVETAQAENGVPDCCGRPMRTTEKLPVCDLSNTAEHFRFHRDDDACDDGRGGGN